MGAHEDAGDGREVDGPRVVGAASPERDGSVPRRDRPAPAPWTKEVPPDTVPDDYVAKPHEARAMSIGVLVFVVLLSLFLVGMVVDFVNTLRSDTAPATMALGMVYGAVIQFVGWWTVIHLVRHR